MEEKRKEEINLKRETDTWKIVFPFLQKLGADVIANIIYQLLKGKKE